MAKTTRDSPNTHGHHFVQTRQCMYLLHVNAYLPKFTHCPRLTKWEPRILRELLVTWSSLRRSWITKIIMTEQDFRQEQIPLLRWSYTCSSSKRHTFLYKNDPLRTIAAHTCIVSSRRKRIQRINLINRTNFPINWLPIWSIELLYDTPLKDRLFLKKSKSSSCQQNTGVWFPDTAANIASAKRGRDVC